MNELLQFWNEYKKMVEDLEIDVVKGINGNASARLRSRKTLRKIAKASAKLTKELLMIDKAGDQEK